MKRTDIYRVKVKYVVDVWVDVEANEPDEAITKYDDNITFQPDAVVYYNTADIERSIDWQTYSIESEYFTSNFEEEKDD